MSHYYTSCANVTIGMLRPTIPELVHDSDSESGTPLVTPIHTNFGNISNPTDFTSGPNRLAYDEYCRTDKHLLGEGRHNCPPAPRIDNGSFEWSFELDMSMDPSFKDNHNRVPGEPSAHLQRPLGDSNFLPEVGRAEAAIASENSSVLKDHNRICTVPRTPRPDTGSRSSNTENVAYVGHWKWNLEKRDFWRLSELRSITPSVSVRSTLSQYTGSNSKTKRSEQPRPDEPTGIAKWNLGLGLTLDDIAEPDGCGASVGELSMDFAEDSFFDLDSGYCSDTTLNTTTETIPDLAMPCPNSPVGSASQAPGPELGITPRLRMLTLQNHPEGVNRQRVQHLPMSGSGTRLAYTTGYLSETDVVYLVGSLGKNERGEFCGLSKGATHRFAAGEYPLIKEAQGGSECQMADSPIFALLPPIEL
ncbi:unnamed protein product [Rhizoctonia solani]|uniref:Uncharacterized protein n=1 Tax=Rhizoctonia solani TaxID=456999 RepID=A0A8H3DXY2_9AGAM|nr:unnamed protein product [Rhizoctonia solani]